MCSPIIFVARLEDGSLVCYYREKGKVEVPPEFSLRKIESITVTLQQLIGISSTENTVFNWDPRTNTIRKPKRMNPFHVEGFAGNHFVLEENGTLYFPKDSHSYDAMKEAGLESALQKIEGARPGLISMNVNQSSGATQRRLLWFDDRETAPAESDSPPPGSSSLSQTDKGTPAPLSSEENTSPTPSFSHPALGFRPVQYRIGNYQKLRSEALLEILDSYDGALAKEKSVATQNGELEAVESVVAAITHAGNLRVQIQSLSQEGEVAPLLPEIPPLQKTSPNVGRLFGILRQQIQAKDVETVEKLDRSLEFVRSDFVKAENLNEARTVEDYRAHLQSLFSATRSSQPPAKATSTVPKSSPTPKVRSRIIQSASKDRPFRNNLGMRFVPVPITGGSTGGKIVLFSTWETRVQDYAAFIEADKTREWPKTEFEQDSDHPAVNVSWDDAVAFCEWLTAEEQKTGKIGKNVFYRLPTDHEWSCAVGIGTEEDAEALPKDKSQKLADVYPWGTRDTPPRGAGNFYGEEAKANHFKNSRFVLNGYEDRFDRTAPVGSFKSNAYGLFDMSGNASEWCQDNYTAIKDKARVLRGGSWRDTKISEFLSSHRTFGISDTRFDPRGFRVVLSDIGTGTSSPPTPVTSSPASATTPLPDTSGPEWHALFPTQGMGDWKVIGDAEWSFQNGTLACDGEGQGVIYRIIDSPWFDLEGEVEWDVNTNSGIIFHRRLPITNVLGPGGFEFQMGGSEAAAMGLGCGGLFAPLSAPHAVSKHTDFPDNSRIPFRLLVEPDKVTCWIDGKQTAECEVTVGDNSSKVLGFQMWSGSKDLEFHDLRIHYLNKNGRRR